MILLRYVINVKVNLKRIYYLLILFVNFSKIIVLIVLMCYTKCTKRKDFTKNGECDMETFSYKAVDASGKDVKGAVEAESKDEAARKIKEQGFTPISIGKQGALDKDVNLSFLVQRKYRHEI